MKIDTSFVFVYGSLRKHEGNHRLLAGSERIVAQCYTEGKLYDTGFGFPAMTQEREGRVYGELYQVTPEVFRRLDALEGYHGDGENNHYNRIVCLVHTDIGEFSAYVYIYPKEKVLGLNCIELGDWKFRRLRQSNRSITYFAYASCMDEERFKLFSKDYLFKDVLGRGVLDGYTLKFTHKASNGGRADLTEIGGVVEGKAYRIGHEALEYLLLREGVENRIYRAAFVDIHAGNTVVKDALTFLVIQKAEEEASPPKNYLDEIRRGGKTVWTRKYEESFEDRVRKLGCMI